MRKIIHIDMDAFFASVEQRDSVHYQNKPLVVCSNPIERSVVMTASYEAREYGVHSGMPYYKAKKLCPSIISVSPRFEVYRDINKQICMILSRLTDSIEKISLDEAYLDVTNNNISQFRGSATYMAQWLRFEIYKETALTSSIGVSFNKMLAKIASNYNKPNGITVITPDLASEFMDSLPVEKICGIGKETTKRMHKLGIKDGKSLRNAPINLLLNNFGKRGIFYHNVANGIDERNVQSDNESKCISCEKTFISDLSSKDIILRCIIEQGLKAFSQLNNYNKYNARTITIIIRFNNFSKITRSYTSKNPLSSKGHIKLSLERIYTRINIDLPVRLVGVSLSNFEPINFKQNNLFNI